MNELEQLTAVMIKDRKAITSSLNVAQVFHKRHGNVLRAIDNLKNNWSCLVEGLANFNGVKFEECFFCLRNEAEEIPAPQEAPQIEQESLFDHEPQAPQTQEERDLEYLKRRLLNDVLESTTVLELGKNIVKTLELITVLDK